MKVFGIADLHLCASGAKPMDVFGPEWSNHAARTEWNWRRAVGPDDLVLICGDLSWAMTLDEARPDLEFVESLPGRKFFIRGNHDYWFSAPGKVRAALGPTTRCLRFDAAVHGGVGVCGVRGWLWPGHPDYRPERDERHYRRAVGRLELSLQALAALEWEVAVAMFHYPPRDAERSSELCDMIAAAGVRQCIYGHVHGADALTAFEGEADGVRYRCVSADHVGFAPAPLFERAD
jgi:predicted phosphohydrolase